MPSCFRRWRRRCTVTAVVRAAWVAVVVGVMCGAATACAASPTLYGVERVNSCLVLNGADITDQGKGYVWVNRGGPGFRKASGHLLFFLSASAAQAYSTKLRRTFKSNPIWTIANVSLLGSGPGIYQVVKACLGSKQRVSENEVMAGVPAPRPVVFGDPAKVLPTDTLAHGWEAVGRRSGRGRLRLEVELRSRQFKAFAVSVSAPPGIQLHVNAFVACATKDGAGTAIPVWYTGGAPVVLKLESEDCGHQIAPRIEVDVRAEQGAKDLPVSARLFMRR